MVFAACKGCIPNKTFTIQELVMKTVYILSPDYPSYVAFIDHPKRRVKSRWKYMTSVADIFGIARGQLILLDGYKQHPHSLAILDYANGAGWDVGGDY